MFRLQRICGCVLSSSKTEKTLFFLGLFCFPLIRVAKFVDNEKSVCSRCNMLAGWRHVKLSKSTTSVQEQATIASFGLEIKNPV